MFQCTVKKVLYRLKKKKNSDQTVFLLFTFSHPSWKTLELFYGWPAESNSLILEWKTLRGWPVESNWPFREHSQMIWDVMFGLLDRHGSVWCGNLATFIPRSDMKHCLQIWPGNRKLWSAWEILSSEGRRTSLKTVFLWLSTYLFFIISFWPSIFINPLAEWRLWQCRLDS